MHILPNRPPPAVPTLCHGPHWLAGSTGVQALTGFVAGLATWEGGVLPVHAVGAKDAVWDSTRPGYPKHASLRQRPPVGEFGSVHPSKWILTSHESFQEHADSGQCQELCSLPAFVDNSGPPAEVGGERLGCSSWVPALEAEPALPGPQAV